jgi:hypothetical protein
MLHWRSNVNSNNHVRIAPHPDYWGLHFHIPLPFGAEPYF